MGDEAEETHQEYRRKVDTIIRAVNPSAVRRFECSDELMRHPWHSVPIGQAMPDVVNAVIEVPFGSRVPCRLDALTGHLHFQRVAGNSIVYPANYGFIPRTLAEDGSALDVLVLCQLQIPPLSLTRARPIGLMPMMRGDGQDDKIVAVCVTDPEYNIYFDVSELPPFRAQSLNQFFHMLYASGTRDAKQFKWLSSGFAKRAIQKAAAAYEAKYSGPEGGL